MDGSYERREELLRRAKQMERQSKIPAVDPKYRHIYRGLYEKASAEETEKNSFFTRLFISFLIFSMFVAADYTGEKIWKYTPAQIISQIMYQPDLLP